MDYISRYGFTYNPFLKENVKRPVETKEYTEVLTRLNYLKELKGFGLLTGESGLGKTTCIRNFLSTLNQSAYKVIYLPLSTLSVTDFYRNMAEALGYEPAYRKADNFSHIKEAIDKLYLEKKITPLIILDEANYLPNSTLNDLKILFNFDMDSSNRAIVLLSGLTTLNRILNQTIHEPLRQRIVMNYTIAPLDKTEARSYILDKLKQASSYPEVFSSNAIEALIAATNGVPRLIDKLANATLLIGAHLGENIIQEDAVMKAYEDTMI